MPLSLQEVQVGNLYTICQISRDNTGGGEGIVFVDACDDDLT